MWIKHYSMNYYKREKYKGNTKIGPWFNFENLKDVDLMVHMVGLSQILIFSFHTIPGLCVSIITKYTNKRGTQFQICTVMSTHILKAVIKCPAAGHGLK